MEHQKIVNPLEKRSYKELQLENKTMTIKFSHCCIYVHLKTPKPLKDAIFVLIRLTYFQQDNAILNQNKKKRRKEQR